MNYCVMCGSPLPDDQGSSTCSMCYGEIEHGKDGYYREWMEKQEREEDPRPAHTEGQEQR